METTQVQHTPGPWYEAKTGNHQGLVISEANGANIAVTYDKKDTPLIAAAPSLLAACQEAFKYFVDVCDTDDAREDDYEMMGLLQAVIAKAENRYFEILS